MKTFLLMTTVIANVGGRYSFSRDMVVNKGPVRSCG